MTADERLGLVQVKIERAKKHIANLDTEIKAFFDSKPYEIGTKHDPQLSKVIYYMTKVERTPNSLAATTGDVIQNLRSALDHLAHQLLLVGCGNTNIEFNFPISNTAKQHKATIDGKIKLLRQDAIDALHSVEAYKGGKGHQIWVLNRLNNIDKHRLLVTVGSAFTAVNTGAITHKTLQSMKNDGMQWLGMIPKLNFWIRPADTMCPLKKGDELFIDNTRDTEPNKDIEFRLEVALHEPGIIESKPVTETLQHFADLVSSTVLLFKSCLN